LQLQYNELGQQLTSTQQELSAKKLLLTQNLEAHKERERSITDELDRRQVEIGEANMKVANAESSMNVLRQHLADTQSRLAQSQTIPPPSTRQFNSWDSYQEPPSTPMVPPRVRDDNLHGAIGDQQLILDILTLYVCLCMVRIYISIQEGAAVVVKIRGFQPW